ncbi:Hypothetical protein D9617_13g100600 [Elsinoe fawcettii]|nr:Hypothetical protein D9617_13g100600 [Elsinoe fawcettii]
MPDYDAVTARDRRNQHCLDNIQALFKGTKAVVEDWPGTKAYHKYIEQQFEPLLDTAFEDLWKNLGLSKPQRRADCWAWFNLVTENLSREDDDNSIQEIWRHIIESVASTSNVSTDPLEKSVPMACYIALFAAILWSTMALKPAAWLKTDPGGASPPMRRRDDAGHTLEANSISRPLPVIFRQLRNLTASRHWHYLIGNSEQDRDSSSTLYLSNLNYATLHGMCNISISWVDEISLHLAFEPANRQLSVFRFPSFCALSTYTDDSTSPLITKSLEALYSRNTDEADGVSFDRAQPHREILMSYRLLFGQSRSARKLVTASLAQLFKKDPDTYDTLLDVLCTDKFGPSLKALGGTIWPATCRDPEKQILQEHSAYGIHDDFPMFGQRLDKLQMLCKRQQPNRLLDLWQDRRNPLQWYTFWIVTIVGGLTILLTILQLLISIAQLIVAIQIPDGVRTCT